MGKVQKKARRRATATVNAAYLPAEQSIQRDRRQTKREGAQNVRRTRRVYNALDNTLEEIGRESGLGFTQARAGLGAGLSGMSSLTGLAGGPSAEMGSSGAVFSAIGAGGMSNISSSQAQTQAWNSSQRRQAAWESTTAQRNYLYEMNTQLKDLHERMLDLQEQKAAEIAAQQQQEAEAIREEQESLRQQKIMEDWIRSQQVPGAPGVPAQTQAVPMQQPVDPKMYQIQVPIPQRMQGHPTGGEGGYPPAAGGDYTTADAWQNWRSGGPSFFPQGTLSPQEQYLQSVLPPASAALPPGHRPPRDTAEAYQWWLEGKIGQP